MTTGRRPDMRSTALAAKLTPISTPRLYVRAAICGRNLRTANTPSATKTNSATAWVATNGGSDCVGANALRNDTFMNDCTINTNTFKKAPRRRSRRKSSARRRRDGMHSRRRPPQPIGRAKSRRRRGEGQSRRAPRGSRSSWSGWSLRGRSRSNHSKNLAENRPYNTKSPEKNCDQAGDDMDLKHGTKLPLTGVSLAATCFDLSMLMIGRYWQTRVRRALSQPRRQSRG